MGQRLRHFGALMKKNWIIWKRSLVASLCELFCPVALMAIMAIARALIDPDWHDPASNMASSAFFHPIDNLQVNNITTAFDLSKGQYSQFMSFSGLSFEEENTVLNFLPTSCTDLGTGRDPERPIIAYTGTKALTDKIV